jgi:hypothetical protein
MGINVQCGCGKQIGVADVMEGRFVHCPACDGDVLVVRKTSSPNRKGAAAPARKGKSTPARNKQNTAPTVVISPTLITAGIIGGVILLLCLGFYLGPYRVESNWTAMSSRANDEVTDVISYALLAYDSQHPDFSLKGIHAPPQMQGDASFVPPMMAFTMPANIIFLGKTSRGNYTGTWNTSTGEVVAEIETNGWTIGGLADARKATNQIRITGREKDGKVTAEMDGAPLTRNW